MDKEALTVLLKSWNNLPYDRFLGHVVKSYGEGRCVVELPITSNVIGPYKVVHAGIYYSLCEIATFFAALTVLPEDKLAVTGDINISVLKSVADGKLLAEAWVLKLGKRTCIMEARITDDGGEPVAAARTSKMIISRPPKD